MKHNIEDYTQVVKNLRWWTKDDIIQKQKLDCGGYLFQYKNKYYMITDNGGETNVLLVNGEVTSIPHTSHKLNVSELVLAYRIGMRLLGLPINWNITHEELENALTIEYKAKEVV